MIRTRWRSRFSGVEIVAVSPSPAGAAAYLASVLAARGEDVEWLAIEPVRAV